MTMQLGFSWNGSWTNGCDFPGSDLGRARALRGQECDGICHGTTDCTHYSWSTFEGGTCFLKCGPVSKSNAVATDQSMVCGIVSDGLDTEKRCPGIIWNGNVAHGCDFEGNDLGRAKVKGEDCEGLCGNTTECTHFSWSKFEGGTCFMKQGPVSKFKAFSTDQAMLCGIVEPRDPPTSELVVPLPAVLVPIATIILIGTALGIFHHKNRHKIGKPGAQRMRKEGNSRRVSDELAWAARESSPNMYSDVTWETEDSVIQEYLQHFTVPSCKVRRSSALLGKGQFGTVHKALVEELPTKAGPVEVAMKTLMTDDLDMPGGIRKLFEDEIRVMLKAGQHLNVVNLLGVTISEYPALLLELCEQGSLLTYLQNRRPPYSDYVNLLNIEGELDCCDSHHSGCDVHPEFRRSSAVSNTIADYLEKDLSTKDLMSFSYQVCCGLAYLASRSIIHRDIAARNVLVARNKIVKISDFGMAKFREKNYVLSSTAHAALPVRWMAPEAIKTLCFTYSSDVWSFGILLWEIFTLGQTPYTDMPINGRVREFAEWLMDGNHLEHPEYAPKSMFQIMVECWTTDAASRPNIHVVLSQIERLISADSAKYYLTLDEPYQRFNTENRDLKPGGSTELEKDMKEVVVNI